MDPHWDFRACMAHGQAYPDTYRARAVFALGYLEGSLARLRGETSRPKDRGGRPPVHNLEDFLALARRIYQERKPKRRSQLLKLTLDDYCETHRRHPSNTWCVKHLRKLWEELQRAAPSQGAD